MSETVIKRSDLVDSSGKLTKLGCIAFIFLTMKVFEISCKEFNKFISDYKE